MSKEIWESLPNLDKYLISNYGRIKSFKYSKPRILKAQKDKDGYLRVGMIWKRKSRHFYVHRLVAKAFIPNPKNKPIINHLDSDKENNHVSNLEWCTQAENIKHAYENGFKNDAGELNGNSKLTAKQVKKIRELHSDKGYTMTKIADMYDITIANVSHIISYYTWKHV